jgi:hypothetical protein
MTNQAHVGSKSAKKLVVSPRLIDQSAANTVSASSDMHGYDRVRFTYHLGAMASGAGLSSWVIQSHESNLANAVNVSGRRNGVADQLAALTNVSNADNNSLHVLDVAGKLLTRRYVGVVVDAITANITAMSVESERFRGTGVVPPADDALQYVIVAE